MSNNHISSSEFTNLCQSQIALLSKSLGAVWSVIYLTEEVGEGVTSQVYPFAIYPQADSIGSLDLPTVRLSEIWQQFKSNSLAQLLPTELAGETNQSESARANLTSESTARKQIILPLVHQEAFIGLLVTGREDREWRTAELKQVEEIGNTIAIARFLELQYHWTKEALAKQENLRRIERDRLEDLLHQLRNPLTALRTFGKLLVKRLLPEDANRKIAQSLLEQSDRFQQLLEQFEKESNKDSLIDSYALENNPHQLLAASENTVTGSNFLLPSSDDELKAVDLQQIFQPLLNTLEEIAKEKEIDLKNLLPETITPVKGDFSALREIFNNLIDNALKYTPSKGKVQLELVTQQSSTAPEMLGIAIKDTGYGIPAAVQERIFERHYRGIQEQSNIPGTGLGLAIARELAVKMQGEIELISPNDLTSDSPGTTFIVWLPIAIDN